ncbi:sn-glycerol-3-phosphate ABC transporter ATP-binding protein UgpC [Pseudooceanicola lipolyticus]|uniref:sn-glycerol-3-phosphate ABC transporter ATP-binding protein UgpC n=1 Tax=Pseudooceanicola lipolyticus TaxID=2029104 RepID=A0A2M8IYF9_9RHOB|nr:sn-glycerol-3-phosphate ABC transporter ATP-binding protein UgpC [Pseudooceanicola lipolyticus]PJE35534.1 sn-glycerol-3-phosphate ABC transporter ATP-binding protein UgpC [Pseudooceanicola lipolyticus]
MADIRLSSISKSFGGPAVVNNVDLEIGSGEFLVILGPSGCGKSTLLRLIAGLEEVTSGTVEIDGRVMNRVDPGRRGCAMVFQNYALYPHMSVAGNIGYGLRVEGVKRAERSARVTEIARLLELEALLDRKPAQLSGGQRQRVAMARAMIRNPSVFLFDEPLSNLDAKLRASMRIEIKRLHRQLGTTSVFVTHDQLEAMTMADRMVVMNGGRIEQLGTPQEIYRRPATAFVAGFIGTPAMNLLPGRIAEDGAAELALGWRPCPGLRWPLAPGTAITLGLRPAALTPAELQAESPEFTADLCEDVGTELHLHACAPGLDLVLAVPPDSALPQCGFAVRPDPAQAHLFHGETGQRIEPLNAPSAPKTKGAPAWDMTQPSFT